ncbi:hypothetical protein PAXINDRAFT_7042 [Paxillus involutus ATCC 200175]|nr:hypothetical protein PAXINDRAFT_7042 [Paxillus involutus ATCC 200175]
MHLWPLKTQIPINNQPHHSKSNHLVTLGPNIIPAVVDSHSTKLTKEFGIRSKVYTKPNNEIPHCPFQTEGNFEFAEIVLDAALKKGQVKALLKLISRVEQGTSKVTLRNKADLRKACVNTAAELTPFSKHTVDTMYKELSNPLLAPHFIWDAERLYKHNGTEFERFFDEPWTGDHWWDIQSALPQDVEDAVPLSFVLYADKTKLSSHSTVKGYPVIACCANLPVEMYSHVPEDAEEEGKLGYTNLKHVIWHESFVRLLEHIAQYLKIGYSHTMKMSLIHGRGGKCPCPICLIPLKELHNLSRTYSYSRSEGEAMLKALVLQPIQNIFWTVNYSDPHGALCFNQLHYLHTGCGGNTYSVSSRKLSSHSGTKWKWTSSSLFLSFPTGRSWYTHFQMVIHITFNDGNKMQDLSKTERSLHMIEAEILVFGMELKEYIRLANESSIAGSRLTGTSQNTRPNEAFHGPLKDAYQHHSNGRDIAGQVLCVNHHELAATLIRARIKHLEQWKELDAEDLDGPNSEHDSDPPISFEGHHKLGSPCTPISIQDLEATRATMDHMFEGFCKRFVEFINQSLPAYGYDLTTWIMLPPNLRYKSSTTSR